MSVLQVQGEVANANLSIPRWASLNKPVESVLCSTGTNLSSQIDFKDGTTRVMRQAGM